MRLGNLSRVTRISGWGGQRRVSRSALVALLIGLATALVALALPAMLAPSASGVRAPIRVEVVLDVSGSMAEDGGNGKNRLEGAKSALSELAYSLPASTEMGLRVYGSEKQSSCTDTKTLVPISPLRPEKIVQAARKLQPKGDTPIAYSLTKAAGDFIAGGTARDVIVLISDGEDNCSSPDNPPCRVVKMLKKKGLEVRIETVGVGLGSNDAARDELRCISAATGGDYYDAQDSDALSAALKRISQHSLGNLTPGKQIEGGVEQSRAKLIKPGDYRIKLKPGEIKWFSFDATDGDQPRVLATVQGTRRGVVPVEARNCSSWRVELRNSAGEGSEYSPYGNSAVFDGRGFGSTGASTTHLLEAQSTGIDYPGRWTIQISLGRDLEEEPLDCAEHMPVKEFNARFSLDLEDEVVAEDPSPSPTPTPTPTPSPTPTLAPTPEPSGPAASDKYNNPVSPSQGGGSTTVFAVMFAVAVGGLGYMLYRLRLKRRRGW